MNRKIQRLRIFLRTEIEAYNMIIIIIITQKRKTERERMEMKLKQERKKGWENEIKKKIKN